MKIQIHRILFPFPFFLLSTPKLSFNNIKDYLLKIGSSLLLDIYSSRRVFEENVEID